MIIITLEIEMKFDEALRYMIDGKCLGIRPGNNQGFIELYKPKFMNKKVKEYMLIWNGTSENEGIRTSQYFEMWHPVIVDHREI